MSNSVKMIAAFAVGAIVGSYVMYNKCYRWLSKAVLTAATNSDDMKKEQDSNK